MGIFTSPDTLADEVISLGDPLFGSTVTALHITHESLNDNGQIAIFYQLATDAPGIARVDPRAIPRTRHSRTTRLWPRGSGLYATTQRRVGDILSTQHGAGTESRVSAGRAR